MNDDSLFLAAYLVGKLTAHDMTTRAYLRRALIAESGAAFGLHPQAARRIVDEGLAASNDA